LVVVLKDSRATTGYSMVMWRYIQLESSNLQTDRKDRLG